VGLLDGKVAVIAGAGPGLGREVARAFGREGATVVVAARTEDRVKALAAEVAKETGATTRALRLDITDSESCTALAEQVTGEFGGIDVLVNNAFHTGDFALFAEADFDRWRKVMDVNLFGTLRVTQAALPGLRARAGGRVILVNSMSAVRAQPRFGAYTASKGALGAVAKVLAVELGAEGIRVNAVHPGYIWGDDVAAYFQYLAAEKQITPEEQYREVADEAALRYLPDAEEIAGAVVFLASDLSRAMTGQALGVNGGHWFQGF
jgi:NAD(P)-dependent dehydrogenase (short-subunit alcohol dehydrogenase family)